MPTLKSNKMSLVNLEPRQDLTTYSFIVGTEMNWLFNGHLPTSVLFIPDGYVGPDLNAYLQVVRDVFASHNMKVKSIHDGIADELIINATCIVVGGGSMAKLLNAVHPYRAILKMTLEKRVPFFAWNEGALLACPFVSPDPIPGFPECLGVTRHQFYFNYPDDALGQAKALKFLQDHRITIPAIHELACFVNRPGGSGVRLEDDNVSIDFAGNSPIDPRQIITLPDPNQSNIL